jgi:tellurite resistance-related uncharacterized protein
VNGPAGLPPGLVAYRRTPVFDEDTIPAGLRREHRTKPGVWAVVSVLEGKLRFRALPPPSDPPSERLVAAGGQILVAPEQPHEIAPEGAVRFFVEFYRAPEGKDAKDCSEPPAGDERSAGVG